VIAGIMSSATSVALDSNTVVLWEVWLWWQILPAKSHNKRLKELEWYTVIDYQNITHVKQLTPYFK
jgi:predicted ATP-dependent serine protease